jgi:hypothetical protein
MSKRKLKKKHRASIPAESRAAETLTVAWMLCVAIGLVCDVGAIFVRWFLPDYADSVNLHVLFALLAFSALVVGTLSLCLLPVVLKSRKVPPPPGIIVFAIVVGVMPLLTLATGLAR